MMLTNVGQASIIIIPCSLQWNLLFKFTSLSILYSAVVQIIILSNKSIMPLKLLL